MRLLSGTFPLTHSTVTPAESLNLAHLSFPLVSFEDGATERSEIDVREKFTVP